MNNKTTLKTRISVTIVPQLAQVLEEIAKAQQTTKSAVVEQSLRKLAEETLANDAKKLAELEFSDLPSEEEWLQIQSGF